MTIYSMTQTALFDPYDVRPAVTQTTIDNLEQDPIYVLALEIANDVQQLYPFVRERPRWENLFDQCARSSSSVALNFAQGFSKIRGFQRNDFLCARGELGETYAALSLLPKDWTEPIKVKVKTLYKALDERILAIPEKYERPYWKN